MVRMNRAVLPLMRERGGGKIVLFSSINGLLGIPFQGAYTASKHAIEGYAECLQLEVKPFGIQVMLVEPGDVCADWQLNSCLKNVGKEKGRIKSKAYLDFILKKRLAEDYRIELGVLSEDDRQPVKEIRREYEEKYGSIYM